MRILSLTALFLIGTACTLETDPVASFSITVDNETFEGTSVDCKVNTSYPEGDPLRGRFFVSADDYEDRGFSALIHFVEHTDAPPPGDYDAAVDVAVQAGYEDPDEGYVGGSVDAGMVQVDDEAGGFRVTFGTTTNLRGSIFCPFR